MDDFKRLVEQLISLALPRILEAADAEQNIDPARLDAITLKEPPAPSSKNKHKKKDKKRASKEADAESE